MSSPVKRFSYSFCFPFCNFLPHFLNILGDVFYNMKPNTKDLWKHDENKCTMAENCSAENDSKMLFSKIQDKTWKYPKDWISWFLFIVWSETAGRIRWDEPSGDLRTLFTCLYRSRPSPLESDTLQTCNKGKLSRVPEWMMENPSQWWEHAKQETPFSLLLHLVILKNHLCQQRSRSP